MVQGAKHVPYTYRRARQTLGVLVPLSRFSPERASQLAIRLYPCGLRRPLLLGVRDRVWRGGLLTSVWGNQQRLRHLIILLKVSHLSTRLSTNSHSITQVIEIPYSDFAARSISLSGEHFYQRVPWQKPASSHGNKPSQATALPTSFWQLLPKSVN
jgi:hypothetical protein